MTSTFRRSSGAALALTGLLALGQHIEIQVHHDERSDA